MKLPLINYVGLKDTILQRTILSLVDFLRAETPLQDFRLVTATFTTTGKQTFSHGLGYQPKDVLLGSVLGLGGVAFNPAEFTDTLLSVTLSGTVTTDQPTTIRCLAGIFNQGAT